MTHSYLQISKFVMINKSNQPGRWHLILDFFPDGHSVNDGIPKHPYSVQYLTVDNVTDPEAGVL